MLMAVANGDLASLSNHTHTHTYTHTYTHTCTNTYTHTPTHLQHTTDADTTVRNGDVAIFPCV